MAKHTEMELSSERSYYTLLPLVHKEYPELKLEDIKNIVDTVFSRLSAYINDGEEVFIKNKDKIGYFKFLNPDRDKVKSYINKKVKLNKSRKNFFDCLSTLNSLYGKTKKN